MDIDSDLDVSKGLDVGDSAGTFRGRMKKNKNKKVDEKLNGNSSSYLHQGVSSSFRGIIRFRTVVRRRSLAGCWSVLLR